jgi:hypothetical protein
MMLSAWMVFMNRGRNSDKTAPQKPKTTTLLSFKTQLT